MTINFELKLIELVTAMSEEAVRLRDESVKSLQDGKEDLYVVQSAIADSLGNIVNKFQGLEDGR